jgi:hypothetical protein
MCFTVSGGRGKMDAVTDTHTAPLAEICTEHLKTNKEEHHHIPVYENEAHISDPSKRVSDGVNARGRCLKQCFTNTHEVW